MFGKSIRVCTLVYLRKKRLNSVWYLHHPLYAIIKSLFSKVCTNRSRCHKELKTHIPKIKAILFIDNDALSKKSGNSITNYPWQKNSDISDFRHCVSVLFFVWKHQDIEIISKVFFQSRIKLCAIFKVRSLMFYAKWIKGY